MRHLFLFMQNFHINSARQWSHPEWSKARALVGNSWDGKWVHRDRGGWVAGWLEEQHTLSIVTDDRNFIEEH